MKLKNTILAASLLMVNFAFSEIITVALVGGDYNTIHAAVNAASDSQRDTVMVLSGTYIFTVEQGAITIDKELALIGSGYDAVEDGGTKIHAPGQIFIFTASSDESNLAGFRFQGSFDGMVSVSGSDIVIEENMFQNNSTGYALIIGGSQDTVRNNIFTNGTAGTANNGLAVYSTADVIVNNNIFASNNWAITTDLNTDFKIVNNIFINNSAGGIYNGGYNYYNYEDNPIISGNIFMTCGTGINNRGGTPTVAYNGFYNNSANYSGANYEANTNDPLFVNYDAGDVYNWDSYDEDNYDFHLQSTSTYIDAGPPEEEWYDVEPGEHGLRNDLGIYGFGWPIGENGAPTIPVVNTISVSPSTVSPSGTITIEATGRIGE